MEGGTHAEPFAGADAAGMDPPKAAIPIDTLAAVAAAGARLAPAHATGLRLAAEGSGADEIADALGIPVESVAPLLEIARAKLARFRSQPT
jgi:DNA-directed RNA polymerase specialized sigma24 family protein